MERALKRKPRILFCQTINAGITYYRLYCFAKRMAELELADCRLFPPWDPQTAFKQDWAIHIEEGMSFMADMLNWCDLVVCQYLSTPHGVSLVEAMREFRPVYCEIDDYVSGVPSYSHAYNDNRPGDRQEIWATKQMMSADGVICSTQYLADQYRRYNSNITVIPNCIDFDHWDKLKSEPHDGITIGWIGGSTHTGDLKIVKNILYKILDKYPNVTVKIVIPGPLDWPAHPRMHILHEWQTIDAYPKRFKEHGFDIGIAPLRDNSFNRAKSNLRYLEYSACGIPTVASRVEPFKRNFKGFLCDDESDWKYNLESLIDNEALRLDKGLWAYDHVKQKYNLNDIARDYADFAVGAINDSTQHIKSAQSRSPDRADNRHERSNL